MMTLLHEGNETPKFTDGDGNTHEDRTVELLIGMYRL